MIGRIGLSMAQAIPIMRRIFRYRRITGQAV